MSGHQRGKTAARHVFAQGRYAAASTSAKAHKAFNVETSHANLRRKATNGQPATTTLQPTPIGAAMRLLTGAVANVSSAESHQASSARPTHGDGIWRHGSPDMWTWSTFWCKACDGRTGEMATIASATVARSLDAGSQGLKILSMVDGSAKSIILRRGTRLIWQGLEMARKRSGVASRAGHGSEHRGKLHHLLMQPSCIVSAQKAEAVTVDKTCFLCGVCGQSATW